MLCAMQPRPSSGVAALALSILALSGCAATSGTEATPTPTGLGKVSTIEQVRDAFIDAGGVCNWEQTDVVADATASGDCSDGTVIMLFRDSSETQEVVDRLTSINLIDVSLLVGENWIINSSEAVELAGAIGGEPVVVEAE